MDDRGDHRPGAQAAKEYAVQAPLDAVDLSKDEIRELSKRWDLPTWNKPSFACLSSRFPYGQQITVEKLSAVEQGSLVVHEDAIGEARFGIRAGVEHFVVQT